MCCFLSLKTVVLKSKKCEAFWRHHLVYVSYMQIYLLVKELDRGGGGGVEMLLLHPCKINFLYVMLRVGEGAGRHGLVWFFRLQTQVQF